MRKKNDLRIVLRSHICDATRGKSRQIMAFFFFFYVLNLRDNSSFVDKCSEGQYVKRDWMGLGRDVMPELECDHTLEIMSR